VNRDDVRAGGPTADANGAASAAERRTVLFRTSGLVVELEITGSGEARQIAGRLIPAQPGAVEIRGVVTVEADARGRFTAETVPPGQVSVRCRLGNEADCARIATGWVALETARAAGG